jgi:hypothetical protein
VALSNQNYRAAEIAATLVWEKGVDAKVWTAKKIEDRLRYLKKFNKAGLAPVNEKSQNLRATEPETLCLFFSFFSSLYFLLIFF